MGNINSNISEIENKAVETKPKFIFNLNDALIELNKAEQSDKYIHKCTTSWSNRAARLYNKYEPYENTKDETKEDTKNDIVELLPKWLPHNTKIILLNSSADNGMPHTRPNIICLPYNESLLKNKSTLFHESIHIHQRILPQVWELVYEKAWKMKRWDFKLPDEIQKYRRYNPDTIMDGLYVWNDEWVVVPVYLRKDKPELDRIRLHFYNIKTGNIIGYIPQDWKEFFGTDLGDAEQEHPNEMAAYSLQKYFYEKERKPNNSDKLLYFYIKQYFPEIFSY
jgi:hypothetical protein